MRAAIGHLFASTDNRRAGEDTEAFLAYLDGRQDVAGTKVGTTGYCMGGGMSFTAAGTYPDRVAAAASFHGGNLATDSELSPHLLAPRIEARVYVAGADNDNSYPPEMADPARAGTQRGRSRPPLRDLPRGATWLDHGRLPRLQRGRRRTPLA